MRVPSRSTQSGGFACTSFPISSRQDSIGWGRSRKNSQNRAVGTLRRWTREGRAMGRTDQDRQEPFPTRRPLVRMRERFFNKGLDLAPGPSIGSKISVSP